MRSPLITLMVLSAVAAACAPATPPTPAPDLAALETEIRAVDAQWLKYAETKDAAGEAALFENGVAYRPNMQPIVGTAAYKAYLEKDYAENPKGVVHWVSDKIEIAKSGDFAVQTGTVHISGMGPKGDVIDTARFVTVWRSVNGQWKVAHDIAVSTMAAAEKK